MRYFQTQKEFKLTSLISLFCLLQVSVYAHSATPAGDYQAAINQTRARIQILMKENNIPGLAVSVAVGNKIIWSEGFGYADIENKVPVTTQTRFRIASISKTITATALAKLVDEGKLDLDKPIQTYVPSFPQKKWPITTRQLGGHLAGIRHYQGNEMASNHHYPTVAAGLEIFKNDPLLHQPGSKYLYSSYGWNLISTVIEGAAKEDFLIYMKKNIFTPLALNSTVPEYNDKLIEHRASFYQYNDKGELVNTPQVDNSYKWAGGGFIAGINDLTVFGLSWINSDFIQPKTKQVFFSSQKTSEGKSNNYGIGFMNGIGPANYQWIGHSGGAMGGRSMLLIYPEQKIVLAFMINSTPEKVPAIATGIHFAEPFVKQY